MTQQQAKIYHELLILQAQSGSRDAFETLIKVWESPFYSYARAFTGSESAAWDAVQETWLVIIRRLNSLSHPACFKSWAFRILNNKCVDYFRKAAAERKLKRSITENGSYDNHNEPKNESLQLTMQRLTPEQRTLVLLRFNQQMSILEISNTLGIPEGTVKSRLHRTLNELKLLYQGDDHE